MLEKHVENHLIEIMMVNGVKGREHLVEKIRGERQDTIEIAIE